MARALAFGTVAIAAALLAGCGGDSGTGPAPDRPGFAKAAPLTPVPGRYIVLMKPGARFSTPGVQVEQNYSTSGIVMLKNPSSGALAAVRKSPGVEQVVQDMSLQWIPTPQQMFSNLRHMATPGPTPNGTDQSTAFFYPIQWNMQVTQADAAWLPTPGGAGKLVCVLDSGVDPGHIDMVGKVDLSKSTSFVVAEPFIEDLNLHGTFVSGLVSSNGLGMASTAPDAQLCAVKVLAASGSGSFGDLTNGIFFATAQGADVINMSLGAYVDRTAPGVPALIDLLRRAIRAANGEGVMVVASSGNLGINLDADDPQLLSIPAQIQGVVSVGATAPINQQNFDLLASYSNFGGVTGIAMVAPGGDLVTGGVVEDLVISACSRFTPAFDCTSGSTYLFGAGTSFAAPMVAGAGAVVESQVGGEIAPNLLKRCLTRNADNVGPSAIFGAGRLNVLKASGCILS